MEQGIGVSGFLLVKVCTLAHHLEVCASSICLVLFYGLDKMTCHLATPDTLHLGCTYHLVSCQHFLSTWDIVMLKKTKKLVEPEAVFRVKSLHGPGQILGWRIILLLMNP